MWCTCHNAWHCQLCTCFSSHKICVKKIATFNVEPCLRREQWASTGCCYCAGDAPQCARGGVDLQYWDYPTPIHGSNLPKQQMAMSLLAVSGEKWCMPVKNIDTKISWALTIKSGKLAVKLRVCHSGGKRGRQGTLCVSYAYDNWKERMPHRMGDTLP